MRRQKKILLCTAAVTIAFLAVVMSLQLLAPRIVDLESVRVRIQSALSKEIGGRVTFERLDISVLPRPCVKARLLRISNPGRTEGTIETLSVYPMILPLFTGSLRVAQIDADSPDFSVRIPEKPKQEKTAKEPHTLDAFRESIAAAGRDLAADAPGLAVAIERGRVTVFYAKYPPVTADQLTGQIVLPPQGLSISMDCRTSYWTNLSIDATVDMQTLAAEGTLSVRDFKPHLLNPYLYPDGAAPISDSLVDLDLSFKTDGARTVQANATGSAPHLRFRRGGQTLLVEGVHFKGSVEHDERKTTIIIKPFKADSPRFVIEGTMRRDDSVPLADLTVTGEDIDIQALRQAILFIAPGDPTVSSIFDVLRAGTVPTITLASTGKTPQELGTVEHMRIAGRLQNGSIDIPGTPFKLTNAGGSAVISKGILVGDQLTARFGNTTAHDGTMRLGLIGSNTPFHLDFMMDADLAQLPPILKAFTSDPRFSHELDLLQSVNGVASGRLVLGESTQSIKTTADISSFRLTALYKRVPYPVELRGGRFFYNEQGLFVEHVRGNMGKSSFTELGARLNLTAPLNLEITSAQFTLALEELHRDLLIFAPVKAGLKGIRSVQGAAVISIQHASIPLARPEAGQISSSGSVSNVTIGSTDLPGPLTVTAGTFKADTESISFTTTDASLLDASLKISGRLNGSLKAIQAGDLTVTGTVGEEAMHWLSMEFGLPSELAVHAYDVSQGRLAWQGKDTVSCSGTLTFRKGPSVTLDIVRDPDKLAVNALRIQDGDNSAEISLMMEKKSLGITYAGTLLQRTLKQILTNDRFHFGRLSGNFKAHVPLDRPRRFTAQGTFEGEHLPLPIGLKTPTTIDRISLTANGSAITVNSSQISFGETHLRSSGTITAISAGYAIAGDISADRVAADSIAAALGRATEPDGDKQTQKKSPATAWNLRVGGTVRFSAGSVSYGKLSAGPVLADITLGSNSIRAALSEASLCGISLPGTVTVTPRDISLDFSPAADRQNIETSLACLGTKNHATGTFTLKGRLMTHGPAEALLQSLQGNVALTSKDGLIYYDSVLVKILSFMSVNQLVLGKLPDPAIEGVPYHTSVVKGTIKQGILSVSEYSIDGPVVDIAGQGNLDLVKKTLDLTVIVAPLTTTTAIIKNIPGVSYILNGTLVTFPLHVYGPFDDASVSYNPVTAVGKGIFGIIKRIVTLPLRPFESDENKQ